MEMEMLKLIFMDSNLDKVVHINMTKLFNY
jgi:hypothetical protein